MKEIFIASQPRSGTTWLNRMLGDALNSPLQAYKDETEPEYFGPSQTGNHIIRKYHFPVGYAEIDAPVILIYRDPRDVAVSRMFYRNMTPSPQSLIGVINTFNTAKTTYIGWIEGWEKVANATTSYEKLHKHKHIELSRLISIVAPDELDINNKHLHIQEAFHRQSFTSVMHKYGDRFVGSMRKGIAGDWKNYFDRESGKHITETMGDLMLRQGYIENVDWWRELDETTV